MASSSLNLHSGGELVTAEELARFKAPPPQGRWFPVPHSQVHGRVRETLESAGYQIVKEQLAVHKDGARFFGIMDLATELGKGVSLSIGLRSSYDKTFPLGFIGGARVFVCSNLSFHSELMVRKRHTRFGEQRFNTAIAETVAKLASFKEAEAKRIQILRETEITDTLAESAILRAWERGIIGAHQLPQVLKEWRTPSYVEFEDRTAWSLYNAFTTILTDRAVRHPQSFVAATMQLGHLLEFRPRADAAAPELTQAT